MGLREKINESRELGMVLAVGVLVVAVAAVVYEVHTPSAPVVKVYFLDLGTNKLFAASQDLIPPIPAPSGSADGAVLASVYACGSCDDESQRVVQHLEKYTPEAKAAAANPNPQTLDAYLAGHLVALKDGKTWYKADSREGQAIVDRRLNCGAGVVANICAPKG